MRSLVGAALAILFVAGPASNAFAETVDCLEKQTSSCTDGSGHEVPGSIDEFIALRDKISKDPWGGATMFVYALIVWQKDKALGEKMIVLATAEDRLDPGNTYKGYALGRTGVYLMKQAVKAPHCMRSYAVGATPKNGYEIPKGKVVLRFRKQDRFVGSIESGKYKVFVCSSGAASCRPVTLKRNKKDLWKVREFSSLVLGCPRIAPKGPTAADEL